jgi:hypothetical protein
MKTILYIAVFLMAAFAVQGQVVKIDTTSNWQKKLVANLNVNQAAFSSNWKGGGVNSFGINSGFNYEAKYTTDKIIWDKEIGLLYGFINNDGQGYRKNVDRIYLDTRYGWKLSDKWSVMTSLNFLSQFSKGYKYEDDALGVEQELLISDFLAPAFITSATGFEYRPSNYFTLGLAPFSPRVTIVNDPTRFTKTVDPKPYGVDSTKTARYEWWAFQLTADFNKALNEVVNLKARYMLYANYETFEWKTIDHRLDVMFNIQAGKFITVGIGGGLIYDFDQDTELQLSQLFQVGFSYSFRNFEEE